MVMVMVIHTMTESTAVDTAACLFGAYRYVMLIGLLVPVAALHARRHTGTLALPTLFNK